MKKIGEELNVTHILEGSVRKSGNNLRITPKLIKVSDGSNLWSSNYDHTMTLENLFKIQEEIADSVIKELKIALRTDASKQIERLPTTDLEAHKFYLTAEFHVKRGTLGDIDSSIVLYKRAIMLDPDFVMAYVALARAYMWKNLSYDPNPKWEEEAFVAVGQSLNLDPDMAEAHVLHGMLSWSPGNNWRVEESLNEFEKAITLKPGLSLVYQYLSMVQYHIGLLDEALISGSKGAELDPLNHLAKRNVGWALLYQGKYAESLEIFQTLPETSGRVFNISLTAISLFYLNRVDEALELMENYLLKDSVHSFGHSSYAIFLASQGRADEANERMQLAIDNAKDFVHIHHTYHNLAGASALMGQREKAVKWLVKAADEGLLCYPFYNLDPNLSSLRGYPAFESFMLKMKKKWEYHKSLYASIY